MQDSERYLKELLLSVVRETVTKVYDAAGSPIEHKFAHALFAELAERGIWVAYGDYFHPSPPGEGKDEVARLAQQVFHDLFESLMFIFPQMEVDNHRADFFLVYGKTRRMVIVECDGYEWHCSRQKFDSDRFFDVQVLIKSSGAVNVMRFSGARLNADARGCAAQVIEYLTQPK